MEKKSTITKMGISRVKVTIKMMNYMGKSFFMTKIANYTIKNYKTEKRFDEKEYIEGMKWKQKVLPLEI